MKIPTLRTFVYGSVLVLTVMLGIIVNELAEAALLNEDEANVLGSALELWAVLTLSGAVGDFGAWVVEQFELDEKIPAVSVYWGLLIVGWFLAMVIEIGMLPIHTRVVLGLGTGLFAGFPFIFYPEPVKHRLEQFSNQMETLVLGTMK